MVNGRTYRAMRDADEALGWETAHTVLQDPVGRAWNTIPTVGCGTQAVRCRSLHVGHGDGDEEAGGEDACLVCCA